MTSVFTDSLIAYNPKKTHAISDVDLSETMSPLTKFTLNLLDLLSKKDKNLVLVLSTFQLKTLPLIAYCCAQNLNKDVFVFCRKGNLENYIKKYCLLGDKTTRAYCFYRAVPFEVTDKNVEVNLYLPRAQRRGIKAEIAHSLGSKDRPSNKIFFNPSKIALENIHTEQVTIDSEKQDDIILSIQPGLIIFEDVDDLVYSQESFRTFLDWIAKYKAQGIRFIFHFSNPYSKFIESFKQETDSVVLDYNLFFLKKYKEKLLKAPIVDATKREITSAYNLDDTSLYEFNYEVLPPLKIRNIDIFYANIERTLKENKLKLEDLSPRLKKLRFMIKDLYNLSIHPSNYKVLETDIDEEGSFKWITMDEYIQLLLDEQDDILEDKIHIYLNIIKNLNQFYQELSQTRRYHDEKSYSSISKNCALLDYIKSLDTESKKDTLINVIVRTRIAKKVLWNDLHKLDLKHLKLENILICMSYEIRSASEKQAIGISCGPPDGLKNLCYLFANHKNVVFLTYEGTNERRLKKLLNDFNNVNLFLRSLAYMNEVLSLVGLRNDTFEKGDLSRSLIDIEQEDEEESIRTFTPPSYIPTQDRFRTLTPYVLEVQPIDNSSDTKKIEATAVTRFLSIQNEGKVEPTELAVRHLKEGDRIILLSSDNKRGMLDLIGDLYNMNSEIDIDEIKEWRDKLVEYIELNEITFTEFHGRYKENILTPKGYASACNWITNRAIGPDRPADIEAIGRTIGDIDSVENSEYIFEQMRKLRSKHVHVGKILNKLVKGILENKMVNQTLNYEEQVVYNLLKLYKIVSIEKGKNI
jgi:hypothetical protein